MTNPSFNIIARDSLGNILEIAGRDFPCQDRAIAAARSCCKFFADDRRVNEITVHNCKSGSPIMRLDMWQWRLHSEDHRYMLRN